MLTEDISFTREQHIGLVTLQRVQALNALTLPMILALQEQLLAWQQDDRIHAVVIQAAAGKAFCAGGDVRWLYEAGRSANPQQMQFFWHEYRLNHFIHHFNKPYIALMDGVTMGGGVGISLHGSHPIASEHFVFAMPETGIGFFPDIGASHLLSRCPHAYGIYLGLTGNRLNAIDAEALGLVKACILADDFKSLLANLINADLSKNAFAAVDACIQEFAQPAKTAPIMQLQQSVNACFNFINVEAIMAALARVEEVWHQETLNNLSQKAPLSLKITLAQIQKAKSMDLADCLKMDYRLVQHFMHDHDFYEGVRALLVDKDKAPKWQPSTLSQTSPAQIADYFECGGRELELLP